MIKYVILFLTISGLSAAELAPKKASNDNFSVWIAHDLKGQYYNAWDNPEFGTDSAEQQTADYKESLRKLTILAPALYNHLSDNNPKEQVPFVTPSFYKFALPAVSFTTLAAIGISFKYSDTLLHRLLSSVTAATLGIIGSLSLHNRYINEKNSYESTITNPYQQKLSDHANYKAIFSYDRQDPRAPMIVEVPRTNGNNHRNYTVTGYKFTQRAFSLCKESNHSQLYADILRITEKAFTEPILSL